MKTIARLDSTAGMRLAQYSKDKGIAFTSQVITEDSGLVVVEISAEDASFHTACDAAEVWLQLEASKSPADDASLCPQCNSVNYQSVDDGTSVIIMKCADCGYSFHSEAPGDCEGRVPATCALPSWGAAA